jgi:phosphatidate phosphatase LPIN
MDPEEQEPETEQIENDRGKIDLDADDEQDVHVEVKSPEPPKPKFKKVLLPTADQLAKLQQFLNYGKNEITYQVKNTDVCIKGFIYYWDYTEKIVISDVDGTVTKSDLGGQVFPRLGISDWAHTGIAKLYSDIAKNGYKILYLSSRAIGHVGSTKRYLQSIKQEGKYVMPEGPLLVSPERTAKSIFVEVIVKKPHLFKIATLGQVKALFPDMYEPFYAGFGNRDTDAISYRANSVSLGKIFIINPKGEVKQFN